MSWVVRVSSRVLSDNLCLVVVPQDYSNVDAQLLLELRMSIMQFRPLPISLIYILEARGWVCRPQPFEIIWVRAALEDSPETTIESLSQELAVPRLTPCGCRELSLHARRYPDRFIVDSLDALGGVDEWDEEDDDDYW